jgi:hypothetical protein
MSMAIWSMIISLSVWASASSAASLDAPPKARRFDLAEFTVRVAEPQLANPFTDVQLTGEFTPPGGQAVRVQGFCDSQDGSIFRLRFCPANAPAVYGYRIVLKGPGLDQVFAGDLTCDSSDRPGPVIVDPQHRKHFIYAGTGKPFYHLGYTAYHLLDPANDDAQIDSLIKYCVAEGFNKIRFLLTGYPRDDGQGGVQAGEFGVADPWQAANYGARAGSLHALPAWLGEPHHYDFSRFNVAYWQKVDWAVRAMRDAGIVATCIFTIEKQGLPQELKALSDAEYRLYRYGVARIAAFDNVWWDLGNEHNEYRTAAWGNTMGRFVKDEDPYDRLLSAHGYADFRYPKSDWADFIITQQYGEAQQVHDWVLKYRDVPKPYVNEEYGYEGSGARNRKGQPNGPGHGQSADRVRISHWSIAMAGGYATYGDWSNGISYFYMGRPGPGIAAKQLKHLLAFFEALPFRELVPHDECATAGFCLALLPAQYVFYFPAGGEVGVDLRGTPGADLTARWYDPRTGQYQDGPRLAAGANKLSTPAGGDWVLHVQGRGPSSRPAAKAN